jgi:hypothetical protein
MQFFIMTVIWKAWVYHTGNYKPWCVFQIISMYIKFVSSQTKHKLRHSFLKQDTQMYDHNVIHVTDKTFTGLDYVYEEHGECLIRRRSCLPFTSTWVDTLFLVGGGGGVHVASLFSFQCCLLFGFVLCQCTQCCYNVSGLSIIDCPFGFL